MDWGTIAGLIDSRLLIVLAACWVIGYGLNARLSSRTGRSCLS